MWRQLELVADVVAALAGVRHVHRQHQCLVAQGLHAVHDLLRQLAVAVQIELEPAVAVWRGGYDLLHGAGGVGAGDVAGVERFCGCGDVEKGRFGPLSGSFSTDMDSAVKSLRARALTPGCGHLSFVPGQAVKCCRCDTDGKADFRPLDRGPSVTD